MASGQNWKKYFTFKTNSKLKRKDTVMRTTGILILSVCRHNKYSRKFTNSVSPNIISFMFFILVSQKIKNIQIILFMT